MRPGPTGRPVDAGEMRQIERVTAILRASPLIASALAVLRDVGPNLYLGAGIIRNAVWDALHGFRSPTPLNDVDVVYFDPLLTTKAAERSIEHSLSVALPEVAWSAKNQARMHLHNGEAPYASLEDAVSKWPETATAVVARLDENGRIALIAPFGLGDLLGLRIVPTPHFRQRLEVVRQRMAAKGWVNEWPRLTIVLPDVEAQPPCH